MADKWDTKSPESDLDYYVDASPKFLVGEFIQTVTWTIPEGLTSHDESVVDTVNNGVVAWVKGSAKIWLSGGTDGQSYECKCVLLTNMNRTFTVYPVLKVKKETYK